MSNHVCWFDGTGAYMYKLEGYIKQEILEKYDEDYQELLDKEIIEKEKDGNYIISEYDDDRGVAMIIGNSYPWEEKKFESRKALEEYIYKCFKHILLEDVTLEEFSREIDTIDGYTYC